MQQLMRTEAFKNFLFSIMALTPQIANRSVDEVQAINSKTTKKGGDQATIMNLRVTTTYEKLNNNNNKTVDQLSQF